MYFDKNISITMRERNNMHVALELKSLNEQGHFAGYASVFNVIDNQRDIILPGAFSGSVHRGLSHIKFLWQHKQNEPIGVITHIKEDTHGLYVQGKLLLDVERAKEAYSLLKEGAISGLSIGYSPIHYDTDPETGVRRLSEVELWEISLVTFPANSNANITMLKADTMNDDQIDLSWKHARQSGQIVALADALDKAIHALDINY